MPIKPFEGFPARGKFTPIHDVFFASILPRIESAAEIKTTLHVFWSLYRKKGYPRFVMASELLADRTLLEGLENEEAIKAALDSAVARRTLIRLSLRAAGQPGVQDIYFLNTEADRRAAARIESGEIELPQLGSVVAPSAPPQERKNIYSLYEANVGMLTPMIAEELKEAEGRYPEQWIEDAFREAIAQNKRSWRYIARILERWETEGKSSGTFEGHTGRQDPDKYVRGKYGRFVQR